MLGSAARQHPEARLVSYCAQGDCLELARRGGFCVAHDQRRTRKAVMSAELKPRKYRYSQYADQWERMAEAAIAYADANDLDREEFERARDRLRKAAIKYARATPKKYRVW